MKSLSAIILALAAIALVILVARPMWDDILAMRAESAVISDNLARLKEVETLRDELLNTYNSISKTDLARLNQFLPPKANTEDLLVAMENMTRARGILLRNINFTVTPDTPQPLAPATQATAAAASGQVQPANVSYNFTVASSYEAFRSLVDAFEKNLRLIDLTEISFGSQDGNVFTFSLKARSYYQK